MSAPAIVTVTRDIAAPVERVFDAWLDPHEAAEFLFATPEGKIIRCDIDARVVGRFLIIDRRASLVVVVAGAADGLYYRWRRVVRRAFFLRRRTLGLSGFSPYMATFVRNSTGEDPKREWI
jgi:hypothetical protein